MKPIDEIFRKWTYDDGYIHVPDCIKDISTLIQKEREEAVKGFCEYLLRKNDGRLLRVIDNMHYTDLMKKADDYLSQTKGGKE